MWSAKWSALAGSASAKVIGSESVYFNPAGLPKGPDREISVSISPALSQYRGSFDQAGKVQNIGVLNLSPTAGITAKLKMNDKWALGAGIYSAANLKSSYKEITYGSNVNTPNPEAFLQATELGISTGYQLSDVWSFGLTWRITYIDAQFKMITPASNTVFEFTELDNMQTTDAESFRFGAQFTPNERLNIGVSYRSSLAFKVKGDYKVSTYGPTGFIAETYTPGSVEMSNQLPEQVSLDFNYRFNETWELFTGLTTTAYSKNEEFLLQPQPPLTNFTQNWNNQKVWRFALEYNGVKDYIFRGGYIQSSAVTSEASASAIYSPAAPMHTFTFGAGRNYMGSTFDLTAEYSHSLANNSKAYYGSDIISNNEVTFAALHVSAKFPF